MEFFTVPDGLIHGLLDVQPLHAFDLRMDAGNAYHVRGTAIADSLPRLCRYAVGLEYAADFQLSAAPFFSVPIYRPCLPPSAVSCSTSFSSSSSFFSCSSVRMAPKQTLQA